MIANTVKEQFRGGSLRTHLHTKSYTKRVDALCVPHSYQPLKSQQFDRKGNSEQHVAHFIKTCKNASIDDDLMIK